MEKFKNGDKVILKTSREIKTLKKAIRNDLLIIESRMGRGGYGVSDVLGNYLGTVRHSDIKAY